MQFHPFARRLLALILTAAFMTTAALSGFAVYAMPIQAVYSQESIYLFDADTGEALVEQNPDLPRCVASLTKMMTTLLLLENYQDQLDSISLTAPSYIYDLIWEQSTNASTADIRRGETQSLRNLLYAMLLPSGNEAAYIVADYMGGGSIDNRHNVCRSLRAEPQQHHDGAGRLSHPARPDGLRCVRHGHRHPQLRHGHK